jgi:hypothetical protein
MGDTYPRLRIAAVQAAPVFLDREATVDKACRLIREAGKNKAQLVGFPEGFIPAHPVWFHFHPVLSPDSLKWGTELFKNAVEIPSPATDALCRAAREANTYVVMGLCERRPNTTGTMYNTQLFIDRFGRIVGKHQKIQPTIGERLVHTGGFGDTMCAFDSEFGRISGLICGEDQNPKVAIFNAKDARMQRRREKRTLPPSRTAFKVAIFNAKDARTQRRREKRTLSPSRTTRGAQQHYRRWSLAPTSKPRPRPRKHRTSQKQTNCLCDRGMCLTCSLFSL